MSATLQEQLQNMSFSELENIISNNALYAQEAVSMAEAVLRDRTEAIQAIPDEVKLHIQSLSTDELQRMIDTSAMYQKNVVDFIHYTLHSRSGGKRMTELSPAPAADVSASVEQPAPTVKDTGGARSACTHQYLGRIAAGKAHTIALKEDGTVFAAGSNNAGQCNVSQWRDVAFVSANDNFTIGVKRDGTVLAAGSNKNKDIIISWSNMTKVCCSTAFAVGLKRDGTIAYAMTGLAKIEAKMNTGASAEQLAQWRDIIDVACNDLCIAALTRQGAVLVYSRAEHTYFSVCRQWRNVASLHASKNTIIGLTRRGDFLVDGVKFTFQKGIAIEQSDIVDAACQFTQAFTLNREGQVAYSNAQGWDVHNQKEVQNWSDIVAICCGDFHVAGLTKEGQVVALGETEQGQCDVQGWRLWQ